MTSLSTFTQEPWGEVYRSLNAKSRKRALRPSESIMLGRAIKELARPAYTRGRARAAVGGFPYPHRSLAEVEAR